MKNAFSSTIAFIFGLIIGGLVLLSGGLLGGMIFGVYVMENLRPKPETKKFKQNINSPKDAGPTAEEIRYNAQTQKGNV